MVMSAPRAKTVHFRMEEVDLLINLIMKYKDIVECKQTNGKTWQEKEYAWKDIEKEFNASSDLKRTAVTLKNKYEAMKKSVRKKSGLMKHEVLKTGGGYVSTIEALGPMEEKVNRLMLLGLENSLGTTEGMDDNRDDSSITIEQPSICEPILVECIGSVNVAHDAAQEEETAQGDETMLGEVVEVVEVVEAVAGPSTIMSLDNLPFLSISPSQESDVGTPVPVREMDWGPYTRHFPTRKKKKFSRPTAKSHAEESIDMLMKAKQELAQLWKEDIVEDRKRKDMEFANRLKREEEEAERKRLMYEAEDERRREEMVEDRRRKNQEYADRMKREDQEADRKRRKYEVEEKLLREEHLLKMECLRLDILLKKKTLGIE